jgi:hypothetical protein
MKILFKAGLKILPLPVSGSALEPTSLLSSGNRGFIHENKGPRHEAGNSPLSKAEVKNAWSYTFILPYVLLARYLIKHRDTLPLI